MHGPSLGIETFLCNDDDGHTKKYCCSFSKLFVGVWDGLNECEISRPEILFQSAPANTYNTAAQHVLRKFYICYTSKSWAFPSKFITEHLCFSGGCDNDSHLHDVDRSVGCLSIKVNRVWSSFIPSCHQILIGGGNYLTTHY